MSVAFFNILPKGKPKPFIIKVDTTLGDGLNQMRLPIRGDNMKIKWGDGNSEVVTQAQQPDSTNWITHTYTAGGIYDIEITNVNYIRFNDEGDKLKPKKVVQWGEYIWSTFGSSFYGCQNLKLPSTPIPNLSDSVSFNYAFRNINISNIPFNLFVNVKNVTGVFTCFTNTPITELRTGDLDGLETIPSMNRFIPSSSLETVAPNLFDNFITPDYVLTFFNNNINQEGVDNILVSINTARLKGILINGTKQISINGGTNATPSQIGKDAADALRGAGWTVALNGY